MEVDSQKSEVAENDLEPVENSNSQDIQFDEVFNVDDLEKHLNEELGLESVQDETSEQLEPVDSLDAADEIVETEEIEENTSLNSTKFDEIDASITLDNVDKILTEAISSIPVVAKTALTPQDENSKKYVIYIDSDNIQYIEELSVNKRKEVINTILREQNTLTFQERERNRKRKYLSHLFLSIITFSICFPILFIFVNKAAKISINNYNTARDNFSKLYKAQSKIKPN